MSGRRAYNIGNEFYVSFNTAFPPRPPSETFRLFYPEHCWTAPSWFDDLYPFMAFTLKDQFWFGKIFGRLQGSFYTFRIVQRGTRWLLHEETQQSWLLLENTLNAIVEYFLTRTGGALGDHAFLHTIEIAAFRRPVKWGYMREHESEKAARIRVLNSRNAFVPLMSLCTYAIATNMDLFPFEQSDWVQVLVEDVRVNPAWANELAFSPFMSPNQVRVGVYVDQSKLPPNLFRRFMAFKIPLWVRIESQVPNPRDHALFRLSETDIIQTSTRNISTSDTSQMAMLPVSIAIRRGTEGTLSNVPNSRQRPGESFEQFFYRSLKYREQVLMKETPSQRDSRQAREYNSMFFNCPGPTGARVFEWRASDSGLKRHYVHRREVESLWNDYANSQKRYDSIRNEWDLCRELDPKAVPEEIDDDDTYLSVDEEAQMPGVSLVQLAQQDIQSMYEPYVPGLGYTTPSTVPSFPLDDTLHTRYGFHPDGSEIREIGTIPMAQRFNENKCLSILTEVKDGSLTTDNLDKLWYFIWAYVNGKHMSAGLHDLNPQNSNALLTYRNRLYALDLDANGHCHITAPATDNISRLIVRSASFGVEILRFPDTIVKSLADVALFFISRGTQFEWRSIEQGTTYVAFNPLQEPRTGLGYRSQGYQTNYYDYCTYVEHRNKLLSDRAIARAALMQGGIIWRLTVESLNQIHGMIDFDAILREELEVVTLSQEDLGIIVGLYNVWTGELNFNYFNNITSSYMCLKSLQM